MQWDDYSLARETREKTLEETLVNTLVHEMQKERGYSAGFIASKGKNFPQELSEQRQMTDEALKTVLSDVRSLALKKPELSDKVRARTEQLADMRQQVDGFELDLT